MTKPTMYIFVNTDLNMSIGKTAAQVAHAASRIATPDGWGKGFSDTVIVLESNRNQIDNLFYYLQQRGIHSEVVIDEGINEVEPHSVTAMAVFIDRDEYESIFSGYKLLGSVTRGRKKRFPWL